MILKTIEDIKIYKDHIKALLSDYFVVGEVGNMRIVKIPDKIDLSKVMRESMRAISGYYEE